jgi:hypothetical protein
LTLALTGGNGWKQPETMNPAPEIEIRKKQLETVRNGQKNIGYSRNSFETIAVSKIKSDIYFHLKLSIPFFLGGGYK